ncbi:MAG TPA: deaminase [Bacteroidota bacterium]|nr:deaminase [Candidatus Kapabacteria bacterium]HRS01458.1 deaminase [Bacteroidota bacterium]HRT67249.1 deaminase [Bacteroidota bacterium]
MKRPDWDQLYITLCYLIGMRSKDTMTHVGSVVTDADNVLVSTGYNSLPRSVEVDSEEKRLSRENDEKYYWIEHAERNAIYNAARRGTILKGCKIYVPWIPCADCARAIIQTGIAEVIIHKNGQDFYSEHTNGKWQEAHQRTLAMFEEANVKVRWVKCNIVNPEIYMNGKILPANIYLNEDKFEK